MTTAASPASPPPTDRDLDGWLSLPSFEPTEGEHLEEIATYSAAPLRALAGALLALQAYRQRFRSRAGRDASGRSWALLVVQSLAVATAAAAIAAAVALR